MPPYGSKTGNVVPCARCTAPVYIEPGRVKFGARFCSMRCFWADRRKPVEVRFEARVATMIKGDGCWEWPGRTVSGGYGTIRRPGKADGFAYTHRLSWESKAGPIPQGLHVLHVCDNPPCLRNDEPGIYVVRGIARPRFGHLFLGTAADNVADMIVKGRDLNRSA